MKAVAAVVAAHCITGTPAAFDGGISSTAEKASAEPSHPTLAGFDAGGGWQISYHR
jgi:hypothetical protein